MKGCVVLITVAASVLLAAQASAGPYFTSSSPAVAHPGQVVTFRGGAGIKLWDKLPLYLVRTKDAPKSYPCRTRDGAKASCEPTAKTPPEHAPYVRIGTVNLRHATGSPAAGYNVAVRFRVPAVLRPGDYAYVVYCVPCARKSEGGSLIAWTTYLRPGGWHNTSLVPAGPALRIA